MYNLLIRNRALILDIIVAVSLVAAWVVNRSSTYHFLIGLATGVAVLKLLVVKK